MNARQYEELCRRYIAQQLGLDIESIRSELVPNPQRLELPTYSHQIDLRWETEDQVAKYMCIANAKWRGTSKVDQPEVLLLQQVRQKIAAHKALMITNSGYTSGAIAAAYDDGIGLHLVTPGFDVAILPKDDRFQIQQALHELEQAGETLYHAEIAHKALKGIGGNYRGDEATANDVEIWVIRQLQRRLDYLRFLATQEYPIDKNEIRELAAEIEGRRRRFEGEYCGSFEAMDGLAA